MDIADTGAAINGHALRVAGYGIALGEPPPKEDPLPGIATSHDSDGWLFS